MNKDIFDLDFQVNKINKKENAPLRVTSRSFCSLGTCKKTCDSDTTFHSNCCTTSKSFCTPITCDKNR